MGSECFIQRMTKITKQIRKIYSDQYTIHINPNYTRLKISNFSSYEENHYLELSINNNCNLNFLDYSLPDMSGIDPFKIFKSNDNIEAHITTFLRYLTKLDEFYINLKIIDDLCFVVEPLIITTKTKIRTFKFAKQVYLKITIDPISPSSIIVNFIGPSSEIENLRQRYNERIHEWDEKLNIYKNLLRMFDLMYFPMKSNSQNELNENLCGICYSHYLENEMPIITCDNQKCDVIFHTICLKKWFSTIENSKTFLKVTMGTCPFCKEKLSTSFAPILNIETG